MNEKPHIKTHSVVKIPQTLTEANLARIQANKGASPRSGMIPPIEHRWKKGQSGNPGGKPKGLVATSARRQLKQHVAPGVRRVDMMVDSQIDKAIAEADTSAFVALRDTVDGRPVSQDEGLQAGIGVMVTLRMVGTDSPTLLAAIEHDKQRE